MRLSAHCALRPVDSAAAISVYGQYRKGYFGKVRAHSFEEPPGLFLTGVTNR
jgi:hypothetical protein